MKSIILVIVCLIIITACNNEGSRNVAADSLGNKITDTTARKDTMYYERMLQKTGNEDSSTNRAGRKDTAYYERLPQKIHQPDSSK